MLRHALALLLAGAALPVLAQTQPTQADAPSRVFTGSDLFNLEQASDPQISPDGRRIAYVRRTGDIMADRMASAIWLIDTATGQQTPLAATGSSPRWSPDGTRLAYVAAEPGQAPQLHVRWLATGATARVTGLPDSPDALAWSPDGRQIAYTMRVPGEGMKLGKALERLAQCRRPSKELS